MNRLWIMPVGFILLALVSFIGVRETKNQTKPCFPFAQKDVPDENDGNWKQVDSETLTYIDGRVVEWYQGRYYKHKTQIGLRLSTYKFFGRHVFKAWECNHNNEPGNTADHTIAIVKDGIQYVFITNRKIRLMTKQDAIGIPIQQSVTVTDKNGKEWELKIDNPHRPQ